MNGIQNGKKAIANGESCQIYRKWNLFSQNQTKEIFVLLTVGRDQCNNKSFSNPNKPPRLSEWYNTEFVSPPMSYKQEKKVNDKNYPKKNSRNQ